MNYRSTNQIRGLGTLTKVVGPNTARLVNLGFLDDSPQNFDVVDDVITENKSSVQCPVCWKYFDEDSNELERSQHVECCLSNRGHVLSAAEMSRPPPVKIDQEERSSETMKHNDTTKISVHPANTFETVIVGRRYLKGSNAKLLRNQKFEICWEPNNKHDSNAILAVRNEDGCSIGHIPKDIAKELGPLLRDGKVSGHGVVLEASSKHENVPVQITLNFTGESYDQRSIMNTIRDHMCLHNQESSLKLLDRLKHIFHTVEQIESKALGQEEHKFMSNFRSHSAASQLLFAKLCQRNKVYFSVRKISSDGYDKNKQVEELLETGLFVFVDITSRDLSKATKARILSDIFQNKDLIGILNGDVQLSKVRSMKREDLVAHVVMKMEATLNFGSCWSKRLYQHIMRASGGIFKISKLHIRSYHRIQRLFFLNEGHSLATWHGVDQGFLRYPKYVITRQREVFENQRAFLDYEKSLFHAHQLILSIEKKDAKAVDMCLEPAWKMLDQQENKLFDYSTHEPPFFMQYNSKWVYSVMATIGIGILEKKKEYRTAIERLQQLLGGHYCSEKRGYWWIRLSTDLEHIGRPTDSLELAETALADSSIRLDEELILRKRILKLSKPPRRWKKPGWIHEMPTEPTTVCIEARPLTNTRGEKCRFIGYDSSICTVEQLALQFYALDENGAYNGIHSEGGIWCSIFSLLLWPALFEVQVPDAFRTSFQTAPLDLGYPGFYESRRKTIDDILENIKMGKALYLIEKSWKAHYGVAVRGVSWDKYDLSTLQSIVSCIGGHGLAAVCKLFCEDYSNWTSGMPDLLLWNEKNTSVKLAEVKSMRDTLSEKQRAWISFLDKSGIPCEVLKIREPAARVKRQKKYS